MGYIQSLRRRSGGFTLVELLVVIAIIGVLATLVLLQLGTARGRARDTQRITQINQIRTAVEQFYEDNSGSYPAAINETNLGQYLTKIPSDPLTTVDYGYAVKTLNGKNVAFVVWGGLEQNAAALKSDADLVGPGGDNGGWVGELPAVGTSADDVACAAEPSATVCIYDQGVNVE